MAGVNLGPPHDLAIRLQKMQDQIDELGRRDVLQNANIGAGGLTVNGGNINIGNGGSLIVTGSGTISLATGTFNANRVTATTSISAPAITGNDLYTLNGPTFNITGGRVTAWLETATGRVGMATSSERFKVILGDGDIDVAAVLSLQIVRYQYLAEVAKRDDPDSEDYVGPDYRVQTLTGLIAERLDEAGLQEWVFYEADGTTPFGIHYSELVVPLLAVVQDLQRQINDLRGARA